MKNKALLLLLIAFVLFRPFTAYAADDNTTTAGYRIAALQDKLSQISQVKIDETLKGFSDMEKHWSRQNVGKLSILEIVDGMPDGTYKPENPIQVDQFVKMTVCVMGFKPGQGAKYWAQPYIDTAMEQKILSSGEFADYTKNITRQEAARIILKAVLLKEAAPDFKMDALVRSKIRDYPQIADADKQSVLSVYELGLMSGMPDGTFKPAGNLTRAEAAAVIMRYLDVKDRKPFTPAADEVCIIIEPDGNAETVYPPSKLEVIEAANALKIGVPKSKGFVETVYSNESSDLFFSYYENKETYDKTSIETTQMSINIYFIEDSDLLKTPYHITVYDPKSVKALHRESIYGLFKFLYDKDVDKAMAAFDTYLEYAINGDETDRVEWVDYNNRKALYYKVKSNEIFSISISSLN